VGGTSREGTGDEKIAVQFSTTEMGHQRNSQFKNLGSFHLEQGQSPRRNWEFVAQNVVGKRNGLVSDKSAVPSSLRELLVKKEEVHCD